MGGEGGLGGRDLTSGDGNGGGGRGGIGGNGGNGGAPLAPGHTRCMVTPMMPRAWSRLEVRLACGRGGERGTTERVRNGIAETTSHGPLPAHPTHAPYLQSPEDVVAAAATCCPPPLLSPQTYTHAPYLQSSEDGAPAFSRCLQVDQDGGLVGTRSKLRF